MIIKTKDMENFKIYYTDKLFPIEFNSVYDDIKNYLSVINLIDNKNYNVLKFGNIIDDSSLYSRLIVEEISNLRSSIIIDNNFNIHEIDKKTKTISFYNTRTKKVIEKDTKYTISFYKVGKDGKYFVPFCNQIHNTNLTNMRSKLMRLVFNLNK